MISGRSCTTSRLNRAGRGGDVYKHACSAHTAFSCAITYHRFTYLRAIAAGTCPW
jgi:hypothetical protein